MTDPTPLSPAAQIDARARAALADQQQKSPTKHELFKLLLQSGGATRCVSIEWIEPFANAVLARWGHHPAPPADGEVAELVAKLRRLAPQNPLGTADPTITRAADLLQRQALVPVSVSERLPGPEVCVPHPRTKRGNWCWGFERCEVSLARPARWRLMHMETVEMEASHWLPAHALPLPEVDE